MQDKAVTPSKSSLVSTPVMQVRAPTHSTAAVKMVLYRLVVLGDGGVGKTDLTVQVRPMTHCLYLTQAVSTKTVNSYVYNTLLNPTILLLRTRTVN